MKSTHEFINAQKMAIDHPKTFSAPSLEELEKIKLEDYVKVSHNAERFWVEVTKIDGDYITGNIENDLVTEQPFKCGDEITFGIFHVHQIYNER